MTKLLKYLSIFLISLIVLFIFIFFNIGRYLNVSETPRKSDIIVCLGGGGKERINKAISLYKKNYSKQNILILTGTNHKQLIDLFVDKPVSNLNVKHIKTKNTRDEIIFIKNYLLKNKLQDAMIISDTPHTRRIKTLINIVKIKNDKELRYNIVGSNEKWWDDKKYYLNKRSTKYVVREIIKLIHTYLAYSIIDKLGLLNSFEKYSDKLKAETNNIL